MHIIIIIRLKNALLQFSTAIWGGGWRERGPSSIRIRVGPICDTPKALSFSGWEMKAQQLPSFVLGKGPSSSLSQCL